MDDESLGFAILGVVSSENRFVILCLNLYTLLSFLSELVSILVWLLELFNVGTGSNGILYKPLPVYFILESVVLEILDPGPVERPESSTTFFALYLLASKVHRCLSLFKCSCVICCALANDSKLGNEICGIVFSL
jgi:hypothetical protein